MSKSEAKAKRGRPPTFANYGANETNRQCRICNSIKSKVECTRQVDKLVIRYRKCIDCGANRITREVVG